MQVLRQGTPAALNIGPFLNAANEVQTAVSMAAADVYVSKNGFGYASKNDGTPGIQHGNGMNTVVVDATDTDTVGRLDLFWSGAAAQPVAHSYMVVSQTVYDRFYASGAEGFSTHAAGDVQVDSDAIATELREKLAALIVWLSSPHDQETGELTLVASTEYKTGGPLGPLRFKLSNASVADADAVRFVAQLATDNGTEQIDLAGTVTLDGSDYFATFEIDAADLDVSPSVAWRYSVLHGTGPAAIIADKPLAVLPSRLPAA